jgi:hypothetical protein
MKKEEYTVVWSGRDPLLPDRDERTDSRMSTIVSHDLDEEESSKQGVDKKKE